MENELQEFDRLKTLIELEKNNYTEAIKNNYRLEEVKSLYLKIKKLEKDADTLMLQQLPENAVNYSAADEIKFLKLKTDFIKQNSEYIAALEKLHLEDMLDPDVYNKLASLRYHSVLTASDMSELILKTIINNKERINETASLKTK